MIRKTCLLAFLAAAALAQRPAANGEGEGVRITCRYMPTSPLLQISGVDASGQTPNQTWLPEIAVGVASSDLSTVGYVVTVTYRAWEGAQGAFFEPPTRQKAFEAAFGQQAKGHHGAAALDLPSSQSSRWACALPRIFRTNRRALTDPTASKAQPRISVNRF